MRSRGWSPSSAEGPVVAGTEVAACEQDELRDVEEELGVGAAPLRVGRFLDEIARHGEERIVATVLWRSSTDHGLELPYPGDVGHRLGHGGVSTLDALEHGAAVVATARGPVGVDGAPVSVVTGAGLGETVAAIENAQAAGSRGLHLVGLEGATAEQRPVAAEAARTAEVAVRA